jgi:hypothetical protein
MVLCCCTTASSTSTDLILEALCKGPQYSAHSKVGFHAQQAADTIKDEASKGTRSSQVNTVHPRNTLTHGNSAMILVRLANNAIAPIVSNRSYIAPANRGNATAKVDRRALLLAMANAAIVNVDVNTK